MDDDSSRSSRGVHNSSQSSSTTSTPQSQQDSLSQSNAGSSSLNSVGNTAAAVPVALSIADSIGSEHMRANSPVPGSSRAVLTSPYWQDVYRIQNHPPSLPNTHICRHKSSADAAPCNKLLKLTKRKTKSKDVPFSADGLRYGSWLTAAIKTHFQICHGGSDAIEANKKRKAGKINKSADGLMKTYAQMNDDSVQRSVFEDDAIDGISSAVVNLFAYSSHVFPYSHATSSELRELVDAAVHYGAAMQGASEDEAASIVKAAPKVSAGDLQDNLESESYASTNFLRLFVEEKLRESGGNPFGEMQHDGGQFSNHDKVIAVALQSTGLGFDGGNFLITLGVPPCADGTSQGMADTITEVVSDLFALAPANLATTCVSDCAPNALKVAEYIGLMKEECMMHNSSGVMLHGSGEKNRSKNKVLQRPFPQLKDIRDVLDKIITYFVHGCAKRGELKRIGESMACTTKRLEAGVNATRIESLHSKIISVIEHEKSLRAYASMVYVSLSLL
jgi:hypothetical protein